MTIKQIRSEIEAIRDALSAPAVASLPSAFDAIESRLNRLATRQLEANEQLTPLQLAELATWWKQRFNREICR